MQRQIIIIGGGAAGFFAAVNIAEQVVDCKVTIVEKSSKILSKVKVSGGGRCNVTNVISDPKALSKNYPRGEKELRKAFHKFSSSDTVKWFSERGVKLKTEPDGRMFPVTDDSQTIIDCLLKACKTAGVKVDQNTGIRKIEKAGGRFLLYTDTEQQISCDALVIATGGSPKKESYKWIEVLGHSIINPVPSLFTFNLKQDSVTTLMGVAVPECVVKIAGTKLSAKGPVLITHWGLSGPAVLKLSAFGARILHEKNYKFTVLVNWLKGSGEQEVKSLLEGYKQQHPQKKITSASPFDLPKRLWAFLSLKAGITEEEKWNALSSKAFNKLLNNLVCDEYHAEGKTTFKEEFVTCGGVDLKEVDFETMQSKICPGLFFCGEVLDIDGITGGFNFQAAWTTGWIAGRGVI